MIANERKWYRENDSEMLVFLNLNNPLRILMKDNSFN